ncbi:unnamed protein product [Absidia cylindrospora]
MNDPTTIYIAHNDNIPQNQGEEGPPSTPVDSMTLSKKVAQNRAAQRAFRERKQHYVEDLENKAKQLDAWKRAMIQLQADNDCLRKTVTRLEDQLKQFIVAGSTLPSFTPLQSSLQQQQNQQSSLPPSSASSSSLSNVFDSSPPSPPSSTCLSSSSSVSSPSSSSASSPPPTALSTAFNSSASSEQNKRKSQLSKREKKRQRLLADEKLYQNDDLEPIQLHCPMAFNNIPALTPPPQQSTMMIKPKEEDLDLYHPFSPTSPPSSIVSDVHPFSDLPALESHDQYINFAADDDIPSSSSSSCSSSYLHLI